ncbi:MAG: NAD(P)-binding domain-containing protein [Acidobacteria bacterium]|nr:NAD(P)-binding domain-containing protein [Acidobacteriota bacterium]
MPVLLSEQDVRIVLPMAELIPAMEAAVARFSANEVVQPLRTVVEVGLQKAFVGVMPAFIGEPAALGTKVVSVFGSNTAVGLPSHLATIVLLDPMTGELLCVMDGRFITESRTAAVSAVSVKHLARSDASRLAIIGSGVQARSHLEAIGLVRTLQEVRVWSRSSDNRAAFAREMRHRTTAPIKIAASARDAVDGADLVVLATASRDSVIESGWIAGGAHVCAVGACRPDQRETDTALVTRARVFVDSRTGALAEAGDIMLPIAEGAFSGERIAGELGEVVLGTIAGRTGRSEVTLFKSLGMAVEDVAAAHLAYVKAAERGLGRGFVL